MFESDRISLCFGAELAERGKGAIRLLGEVAAEVDGVAGASEGEVAGDGLGGDGEGEFEFGEASSNTAGSGGHVLYFFGGRNIFVFLKMMKWIERHFFFDQTKI